MSTAKERLKEIREIDFNGISQRKFADLIGVGFAAIQSIETGTQKTMKYEIAEALNEKYGYSIIWVMSGKGSKFIERKYTLEPRIAIDDELSYKRRNYGDRIDFLRKKSDYSVKKMADFGKITEKEYIKIISDSPFPYNPAFIENITANFDTTVDDLLYDSNGIFKEAMTDKKEGDSLNNIDFESLSPDIKLKIKKILKDV